MSQGLQWIKAQGITEGYIKEIFATGGGAHKFRDLFKLGIIQFFQLKHSIHISNNLFITIYS